jgi:hypothetical protein
VSVYERVSFGEESVVDAAKNEAEFIKSNQRLVGKGPIGCMYGSRSIAPGTISGKRAVGHDSVCVGLGHM